MAFQPRVLAPVHDVAPAHVLVQGQAAVQMHAVHSVKAYLPEMALVLHALVQAHVLLAVVALPVHVEQGLLTVLVVMAFPVEVYVAARFYAAALVSLVEMAFVVQA